MNSIRRSLLLAVLGVAVTILPSTSVVAEPGPSRIDAIRVRVVSAIADGKAMNGEGRPAVLPREYHFPANSNLKQHLSIKQMQGYSPATGTQRRLGEQLMTYRQYVERYTDGDVDFTIAPERMVWVWITEYPAGVDLGGKIG